MRAMIPLLIAATACICEAQQDPLLFHFHASFEEDLTADVAGGDPEPVWARQGTTVVADDTRGNCARVPDGGSLTYDAPANVYWERGTLAFWWLCEDEVGQTEFTVASVGAWDSFYYGRWLRLYASGGRLYMHLWDWHYDIKRLVISSGEFEAQSGQWYHIALGWDAAKGFALYVDGARVASSEKTFYMPVNLNQIGLGVSATAAHAKASATRTQRFDEVRVYDQWLSDGNVAALASGREMSWTMVDEDAAVQHRVESLNLDETADMPVAPTDGRALVVTQPRIVTAKDVLRTQVTGVDGKLTTKWPSRTRYTEEGHRYDIEMAGEPVNYVAMTASHTGKLQLVEGEQGQVLLERTTGDPFVTRALLDEPVMADSAHVTREVSEEDRRHDGAMADLQLLHVSEEPAPEGEPQGLTIASTDSLGETARVIRGEYPDGDQFAFVPGEYTGPEDVFLYPMRSVHFVSEPVKHRVGVSEIDLRLELYVGRSETGGQDPAMRLELMHPLNYTRRQLIVDVDLGEGGPVNVLLRPRALILEPGQRVHLVAHLTGMGIIDLPASGISLGTEVADDYMETQEEQYFDDQMRLLKMYFMRLSEARPWGWPPEKIKLLNELYQCLYQVRELRPDDPRVVAYYHWTHYREPKPTPELAPVPDGIPEWAWYQVKLRELCEQVPDWWIDNRQVETGEFGSNDGPNDDSVLVQDYPGLYLMNGPDEKLMTAARRVSDMCWRRMMVDGMNRQVTAPLHAYEWGA
ncbi:MAG: hypothetical protein GF393_09560, partial [Armatimonadia bacterium]|nr:hypothetical protein [Armatimonadia bacterium]